jgi:nucleotide-binding universal stress UspA family protein
MPQPQSEAATSSVALGTSKPEALATPMFERVFVVVDFAISPHATVGAALQLHEAFGSAVCLFATPQLTGGDEFLAGLGSPSVIGADLAEEAKGRLVRFLRNVAPEYETKVELRARAGGDPLHCLKSEAHRWGATLVVATASSKGGLFVRSHAERVVHGLDIPILLVPV